MFEKLYKIKFLAQIVSIAFFIIGIIMVGLGMKKMVFAILEFFDPMNGKPGIHLLESVDTMLFALVVLILSGGIYKLFVGNKDTFDEVMIFAEIKSFKNLKVLLWETVLLTLTVLTSLKFFVDSEHLQYEMLILPGCIVLLALALKLLKYDKE